MYSPSLKLARHIASDQNSQSQTLILPRSPAPQFRPERLLLQLVT